MRVIRLLEAEVSEYQLDLLKRTANTLVGDLADLPDIDTRRTALVRATYENLIRFSDSKISEALGVTAQSEYLDELRFILGLYNYLAIER